MKIAHRMALASIPIGVVVIGVKLLSWYVSGSVALFSDALEGLVNVAAAVITFGAVRFAAVPPDHNHPYGHGKAELFAAVIEGALIVLAALGILYEAGGALLHPVHLQAAWLGLGVNLIATVINFVWSLALKRAGQRHRSAALRADAAHLMADVVTSVGVTLGVAAAVITGWQILDPIVAALVALHVLWSGFKVISHSVDGLMDIAVTPELMERIEAVIHANGRGAIEAHDLKSRATGVLNFLEFHLVVPGDMSVREAHDICDRIELALRVDMPELQVTIHVEPASKAKREGVMFG